MKDYIKQIIESLVKNPARGVKPSTNMKITYRAGEKLDRAMKYFDDFKSQQRKIQKLMHSAEMDNEGNLVITPRSTQGAKKIRGIMQDVLAPRKQETNEDYLSEKIRDDIPANVQKIAKELGKAVALHSSQAKRLRSAGVPDNKDLPANVRKIPDELDKAVAAHKSQADRLRTADISESYKRGGHMSQIRKNELRDKVRKKITAKKIEGQKRRLKNQTQSQRER